MERVVESFPPTTTLCVCYVYSFYSLSSPSSAIALLDVGCHGYCVDSLLHKGNGTQRRRVANRAAGGVPGVRLWRGWIQ
eukprot:1196402-Prorocentrum_minimum.AAC.1